MKKNMEILHKQTIYIRQDKPEKNLLFRWVKITRSVKVCALWGLDGMIRWRGMMWRVAPLAEENTWTLIGRF